MAVERLKVLSQHLRGNLNITSNLTSQLEALPKSELIEDREFHYTLNNSILTKQQRQFFEDNGYLVIPNLIESDILEECRKHFVDICEGRFPKGGITLMKEISLFKTGAEGEYLYYKAQDILYDEVFLKYFAHPKLLDYVECFTGPNITGVHSMLINKPPDANTNSSRHPMHQDLYYFPFRPENNIVGSWTAMETVNENNGCLFVVPGSHKAGILYQHDYPAKIPVNIAFYGVKGFEDKPTTTLCMEAGDTVFLHPLILHGSGINTTKGFRKAISCHYAASECKFIDIKGTVQEKMGSEIEDMIRKRGYPFDIYMAWKLKARVLRGSGGFTLI